MGRKVRLINLISKYKRNDPKSGKGKPVDELDATCQQYKQCQKCARMQYGEVYIELSL